MAGSDQVTVGTSPVLLAAAPAASVPGPIGWFYIVNGSSALYLGGPNVSSTNGAQVAASGTLSGWLFSGDALYGVLATGSETVGVLTTGS